MTTSSFMAGTGHSDPLINCRKMHVYEYAVSYTYKHMVHYIDQDTNTVGNESMIGRTMAKCPEGAHYKKYL